jgi:hypothetical protein
MKKTPNISGISAGHFNQDTPQEESAADPGAVILEITREKRYYGEHTRRMATLKKMAALQEKVITRMLERSVEKPAHPKRPQLKLVK